MCFTIAAYGQGYISTLGAAVHCKNPMRYFFTTTQEEYFAENCLGFLHSNIALFAVLPDLFTPYALIAYDIVSPLAIG